jgi:ribosomal protein S18 acetylase RimI-like enzyme
MPEPETALRRLELPRDRDVLLAFHRMYDEEYKFQRAPEDPQRLLDYLQAHADIYHCLIFHEKGLPVGYMRGYDRMSTSSCDIVFMLDIVYVAPEHRGKGAGKHMIAELLRYVKAAGAARIDLLVDLENDAARKLYSDFGFRGRTRMQMHTFLKDNPDLLKYFEKKAEEEAKLGLASGGQGKGPAKA